MFYNEPGDSENEQDDSWMDASIGDSGEDDDETNERGFSGHGQPERAISSTIRKPRRQPDASSRHQCKEVDPETGEPCGADFSRAGYVDEIPPSSVLKPLC